MLAGEITMQSDERNWLPEGSLTTSRAEGVVGKPLLASRLAEQVAQPPDVDAVQFVKPESKFGFCTRFCADTPDDNSKNAAKRHPLTIPRIDTSIGGPSEMGLRFQ